MESVKHTFMHRHSSLKQCFFNILGLLGLNEPFDLSHVHLFSYSFFFLFFFNWTRFDLHFSVVGMREYYSVWSVKCGFSPVEYTVEGSGTLPANSRQHEVTWTVFVC